MTNYTNNDVSSHTSNNPNYDLSTPKPELYTNSNPIVKHSPIEPIDFSAPLSQYQHDRTVTYSCIAKIALRLIRQELKVTCRSIEQKHNFCQSIVTRVELSKVILPVNYVHAISYNLAPLSTIYSCINLTKYYLEDLGYQVCDNPDFRVFPRASRKVDDMNRVNKLTSIRATKLVKLCSHLPREEYPDLYIEDSPRSKGIQYPGSIYDFNEAPYMVSAYLKNKLKQNQITRAEFGRLINKDANNGMINYMFNRPHSTMTLNLLYCVSDFLCNEGIEELTKDITALPKSIPKFGE